MVFLNNLLFPLFHGRFILLGDLFLSSLLVVILECLSYLVSSCRLWWVYNFLVYQVLNLLFRKLHTSVERRPLVPSRFFVLEHLFDFFLWNLYNASFFNPLLDDRPLSIFLLFDVGFLSLMSSYDLLQLCSSRLINLLLCSLFGFL